MRATLTHFVFNYKEWIVLVDSLSIFTGILNSSNSSNTQSVMLLDLQDYGLTDVLYVKEFSDTFDS